MLRPQQEHSSRVRELGMLCENCGDQKAKNLCGGCKSVGYCSDTCCKQHWTEHQHTCQSVLQSDIGEINLDRKLKWRTYDSFFILYDFLEVIGKGTYATVYVVRNEVTNELFAAKVITSNVRANDVTFLRMLSEEPNCNKHVMCYKDHFRSKDPKSRESFYIILTEYLEGPALIDYKKRHPFANWNVRIQTVMTGLISGLKFIHSHDVIHGDIKPENIVLRNPSDLSSVVFIDFGLSCKDECDEDNIGTRLFLAPELIKNGTAPTKASDVFALAVSLYSLFMKVDWIYFNRKGELEFDVLKFETSRIAMLRIIQNAHEKYRDVLDQMVALSPEHRITTEEAYKRLVIEED